MTVVAYGVDHGIERVLNVVRPAVDHFDFLKAQQSPLPTSIRTTLVNIRFYF
jgi:hypothetical protein